MSNFMGVDIFWIGLNRADLGCWRLTLKDNSRPKSPTKVKLKIKLQKLTVSGWLIMNGGEIGNEKGKMQD